MLISRVLLVLVLVGFAAGQTKLQIKVHTGAGQSGYDVNSTMVSGENDMIVVDPQFSLSEAHRLAAEILESKKNHHHLHYAPASGSPFRPGGTQTGVSKRENRRTPGYGECRENGLAGAPEVLVPDLRQQYSRTGAGCPGGADDTLSDARRGAISRYRAGSRQRRSGEQLRLHSVTQGRRHRRYRFRSRLLRCDAGQVSRGLEQDHRSDHRSAACHHSARTRGTRSHPRYALDSVHEEIHGRLGRQLCELEECRRDESKSSGAVSGARNGIHAERPHRDVFSGSETVTLFSQSLERELALDSYARRAGRFLSGSAKSDGPAVTPAPGRSGPLR